MTTVGQALVARLKERGVDVVFGIPGVHTVELYRGLSGSGIRHVTPRHEQGAGFMADGYARASGKPGVAFVITGPGLTNTLTPMAQARADSVPMLVVTSVNRTGSLGKGLGHLHELPDQHALASQVALTSEHVGAPDQLDPALASVFAPFQKGRPGPTHIQVPLDIAALPSVEAQASPDDAPPALPIGEISQAGEIIGRAKAPVILAGGGARYAGPAIRALAERLDAPVVQTVNARGMMFEHPLGVPASPSLAAVRDLIGASDVVLALGTEFGPTDYDMYSTGSMPAMAQLIRIDICDRQLARHDAHLKIVADTAQAAEALLEQLPRNAHTGIGAQRAAAANAAALAEIGADYRLSVEMLNALRASVPGALFVGDSTQPIYAGNLFYDHDRPGGWFNAATGYGALGYAIPAAIGAAVASPGKRVVAIAGDGGAQFSLPEIMAAVDENLPITFLIWNNHGYHEIAQSMRAVQVDVVGCDPSPPDFAACAQAFGIPYRTCDKTPAALSDALSALAGIDGPTMVEVAADENASGTVQP